MEVAEQGDVGANSDGTAVAKKYALKLLTRWPYIIGFSIIALMVAYAINRYSTPIYSIQARITTKKFSGKPYSPVPGVVDASFFLEGYTEVYEEIPTLLSPERIERALDKVDFRVSYFSKGAVKTTESINGWDFKVILDSIREIGPAFGVPIVVKQLDKLSFKIETNNESLAKEFEDKKLLYGAPIKLEGITLRVINNNGDKDGGNKNFFVLNRKADKSRAYRSKLQVVWALKGSSMLDISMQSELPEKDVQFIRAYIEAIHEIGLKEKNETLDNTISFIDTQMKSITDSILFYQSKVDNMKVKNLKLNLGTDYIFARFNDLDQKKASIILNEKYLDYLVDYFNSKKGGDVFAPSVMDLKIPLLEPWVNQYITSRLTEKKFRTEENSLNPLIKREDSLKNKLVKGIFESVRSARDRNKESLAEMSKQSDLLYSSIQDVQVDFRELSSYQRLLQLNQTLFDLFLRRKTEAAISKAGVTSDYQVIDEPYYQATPFKPNKKQNYLIASILGLLLPIGFFLFKDLTNSSITDKAVLQGITQMPLLGSIAHSDFESVTTISDHPRSVVAESFRALRANLIYLNAPEVKGCKTYLVTSSVSGEGKTFCSINIAQSLVVSGKKTILVAADLRKPTVKKYVSINSEFGLSELLAGIVSLEDVIIKGTDSFPDILDAGHIPPNPSELLAGERMKDLMDRLKSYYDYIIIDTPPLGLVSDALGLLKFTDFNFLVVRQNVTHKAALGMLNELYEAGKLINFTVIFNDVQLAKKPGIFGSYVYGLGYGGYGYGYYEEDGSKGGKGKKKIV